MAEIAGSGSGNEKRSIAERRSLAMVMAIDTSSTVFTVPDGMSPGKLLDSPVMIADPKALPSPTTGTFTASCDLEFSSLPSSEHAQDNSGYNHYPPPFLTMKSKDATGILGTNSQMHVLKGEKNGYGSLSPDAEESYGDVTIEEKCTAQLVCHSGSIVNQTDQLQEIQPLDSGIKHYLGRDEAGANLPVGVAKPSDDGYNWRKYGQKHVKGSEYPRSYYKCTHINCQVKKKVERCHDGHITEIVYKGVHNHPKPQPCQRVASEMDLSPGELSDKTEEAAIFPKIEEESTWDTHQSSIDNANNDWKVGGCERSSSGIITDVTDQPTSVLVKVPPVAAETLEVSPILGSPDEDDIDVPPPAGIAFPDEYLEDEPELKRRKFESCLSEATLASRNIREPRVVIQIESEVDISDDGYRWRKYGQKVVKGNPNPRSYYKCTNPGCSVRKHVERAANDLKSVITTYEGKHNHEAPTARTCGQSTPNSGNLLPSTTQSSIPFTESVNSGKLETQGRDLIPRFHSTNGFIRPGNLGKLSNNARDGALSSCDIKLPSFAPLSHQSFMPPTSHRKVSPGSSSGSIIPEYPTSVSPGSTGSIIPEFPIPFPLGFHRPTVSLPALDYSSGRTVGPAIHPLLLPQQMDGSIKFFRPMKQELIDSDAFYTSFFPTPITNASTIAHDKNPGGFQL